MRVGLGVDVHAFAAPEDGRKLILGGGEGPSDRGLLGLGVRRPACAAREDGRKRILGGVEIPSDRGLMGHSDADVLAHVVTDALLGAAGLEDIGHYFPDTDARWEDADSIGLLREARPIVGDGWGGAAR